MPLGHRREEVQQEGLAIPLIAPLGICLGAFMPIGLRVILFILDGE